MNTKNNQAYRVTEQKLENAFLELLEHDEFKVITVREICYGAKVNRSTFYTHFQDIPQLIDRLEEKIHSKIVEKYSSYDEASASMLNGSFYTSFLNNIKEYKNFYKACLKTRTSFPIKTGYEEIMQHLVIPTCHKLGIRDEAEINYYVVFYQAGFTYLLRAWVENDCKESVDTIAKYIINCISKPIQLKNTKADIF